MVHGEWDRAVGGGVPKEHSRQMERLLKEKGIECKYTESLKTGHGCKQGQIWEDVVLWLLEQKKTRNPDHVELATFELRHNRSYWVTIGQMLKYGERALVDAQRSEGPQVDVKTENVSVLTLGPCDGMNAVEVVIDGQSVGESDLSQAASFSMQDGKWTSGDADLSQSKRHGCSGPISDLFHDHVILVAGTTGDDEQNFFLDNVSRNATHFFPGFNGGVHRGGILCDNHVKLARVLDNELSDEERKNNNLLLYGTYETNAILAQYEGKLPLKFGADWIEVGGKTFKGAAPAVFAIFPHPENPERTVAVHAGTTPDAITWGSHLHMQLLPDYIAYDGGELLGWGFWDNDWNEQG